MHFGTPKCRFRTQKCRFRTQNCRFRTQKCRFRTQKCRFRTQKCIFRIQECTFRTKSALINNQQYMLSQLSAMAELRATARMRHAAPEICGQLDKLRKERRSAADRYYYLCNNGKVDEANVVQQRMDAIDAEITMLHAAAKHQMLTGTATTLSQQAALLQLAAPNLHPNAPLRPKCTFQTEKCTFQTEKCAFQTENASFMLKCTFQIKMHPFRLKCIPILTKMHSHPGPFYIVHPVPGCSSGGHGGTDVCETGDARGCARSMQTD